MENALALLQQYRGSDINQALAQQRLQQNAATFPYEQQTAQTNALMQRINLEQAQRKNMLMQRAAAGDTSALSMIDPALALQAQGLQLKTRAQTQQENYQNEQLRLKKLEVDPFGMLGGSQVGGGAGPAMTPPGASMVTPQMGGMAQPSAPMEGTPGARNDSKISGLPQPIQDQVKALADGRMAFPSGFALKSPYWQRMISLVSQYDPSFDAVNYNARAGTRRDFTSGKAANNLTAINTAIGHLGSLQKAGEALNNGDIPMLNKALNTLATATGDPRVNNFQLASQAVGDELMRVFRQVGASEQEARSWRERLDAAASPAQMKGALKMAGELLESRVNALNQQYEKGMGKSSDVLKVVYPKSRETLDRIMNTGEANASTAFSDADKEKRYQEWKAKQ